MVTANSSSRGILDTVFDVHVLACACKQPMLIVARASSLPVLILLYLYRQDDLTLTWLDSDQLRLTNVAEPFQIHPDTGHKVWFAHPQVRKVVEPHDRMKKTRTGH